MSLIFERIKLTRPRGSESRMQLEPRGLDTLLLPHHSLPWTPPLGSHVSIPSDVMWGVEVNLPIWLMGRLSYKGEGLSRPQAEAEGGVGTEPQVPTQEPFPPGRADREPRGRSDCRAICSHPPSPWLLGHRANPCPICGEDPREAEGDPGPESAGGWSGQSHARH